MTKDDIISKYLGIPYRHRGRGLNGFDCYGLIIAIYGDVGIRLFDVEEDYTEDWSWKGRNHFIENAHRQWEEVRQPMLFDVVLFKNSKGIVNHAGVMLDEYNFIQTCRAGTVVTGIGSVRQDRIEGFYRYKE